MLSAREDIWSHLRVLVTFDMNLALMASFFFQDLQNDVCSLDAATCSGDDGLTRDFFLVHWDVMHVHLLRGCQSNFNSGSMPESLCSVLISVIRKGGEPTFLRQWHPITLLSLVYKNLAKMISARLRLFFLT